MVFYLPWQFPPPRLSHDPKYCFWRKSKRRQIPKEVGTGTVCYILPHPQQMNALGLGALCVKMGMLESVNILVQCLRAPGSGCYSHLCGFWQNIFPPSKQSSGISRLQMLWITIQLYLMNINTANKCCYYWYNLCQDMVIPILRDALTSWCNFIAAFWFISMISGKNFHCAGVESSHCAVVRTVSISDIIGGYNLSVN